MGMLLVSHRITELFFTDNGKGTSMASQGTFSIRPAPIPKFNTEFLVEAKYSFHTSGYLYRPAAMKSPRRRM